ncbi:MAG: PAS domain S-box protein [Proteobacteria bacterium]|nr:PAS domain S-box protein [Pseudomonadota bacterium]
MASFVPAPPGKVWLKLGKHSVSLEMTSLDIRTLFFLAMVTSVLLAVGLQIVNRIIVKDPSLRLWALGASVNGVAYILLALRGIVPDLFSIVVANTLLVAGSAGLYLGNRKYRGLQTEFAWYWVLAGVAAAAFYYFTYVAPSLSARIVALSASTAAILFPCAFVLLSPGESRDRTVRWFVAAAFLATALMLGARAVITLLTAPPGQDFMAVANPIHTVTVVFGIGLNAVLGIGLPLLVSGRMQLQLLESETRFRGAFETAAHGMALVSIEGRFIKVNPSLCAMLGYDGAEMLATDFQSITHPDDLVDDLKHVDDLIEGRIDTYQMEKRYFHKTGKIVWILLSVSLVRSKDGAPVHFVAQIQDINQRKLDQQRLEHLLAEQKAMLENELIGIVRVRNRTIIWANPAFEKMLGYAPGELNGTPTRNNYPSDEVYESFGAAAYPVLATGKVFRTQIEHLRKDGKHIWADVSGGILDPESGESLWGFIDITERRQLEQSIAQNEARMELALAGADLGLWDLDIPSGRFTHNQRLVTMLGYTSDEIEVSVQTFASLLHPDDLPQFRAAYFAHLKDEASSLEVEYRLRHKDDRWIWILSRGKVVERDNTGRSVRVTGTSLDISERKRTEAALKAREARLSTLIASMQDIVIVFDTGGTVVEYFHPPLAHRPSYKSPEDILGKTYEEIVPDDVATLIGDAIGNILMDEEAQTIEYSLSINGVEYLSQATLSPLLGESKYPTGFLMVVRDVTTERSAQREIEHLARTNALLLESVGEGIYGVDLSYRSTFVNSVALTMLGFTEAELRGQEPHALFHHHRQDGTPYAVEECPIRLTQQDGRIRHDENEWFWRKDGSGFPVAMTVTPMIENGSRVGAVVIFQDITERKANEAKIHDLAFYDPLTKLPNRRLLLDRLGLALSASARRDSFGAILFLDLDNFKILNDTRGHETGDLLLIEVALRLLSCVRAEDTVARFGGDEFVVMLEDLSPEFERARAQAEGIGEKIRGALSAEYSLQESRHHCSSSIGICLFKGAEVAVGEILKRADQAMYQAKSAGRNSIRFFWVGD